MDRIKNIFKKQSIKYNLNMEIDFKTFRFQQSIVGTYLLNCINMQIALKNKNENKAG